MKILKEKSFYNSIFLTLFISILTMYISKIQYFKLFGHLVLALVCGMILQIILKEKIKILKSGTSFISNKFLRVGIILLGFRLSIDKLITDGKMTLLFAFFVVIFMIVLTYFLCKIFKVERDLALLASCGCGICGAAAVMGVSSSIKAKTEDSVLAVAVVAILGTIFTIIEVSLFPYLNLTEKGYGNFTGSSLHEIAHAVAGGGAGGIISLETAILMKLSRVLMLVVVIFFLFFINRQGNNEKTKAPLPYFIIGFILMSVVGSYVNFLKPLTEYLVSIAYIFLGMAMCSLGLNVNFTILKKRGLNVLLACFISSFILMIVCYLVAKYILY